MASKSKSRSRSSSFSSKSRRRVRPPSYIPYLVPTRKSSIRRVRKSKCRLSTVTSTVTPYRYIRKKATKTFARFFNQHGLAKPIHPIRDYAFLS